MKRLEEYLIYNFCKAVIFPVRIIHFTLNNPPKFCRHKDWLIHVYDLSDLKLHNPSGNYFYSFINNSAKFEWFLQLFESFIGRNKEQQKLAKHRFLYSSISKKRIFYTYSFIDLEIEPKLLDSFVPTNYTLKQIYHRSDFEKYMVLL